MNKSKIEFCENCIIVIFCSILPLIYTKSLFDPTQTSQLFTGLILLLIVHLLIVYKQKQPCFQFGYIDFLFFSYAIFSMISLIKSVDISISVFELCKIFFLYSTFKVFQYLLLYRSPVKSVIFISITIHIIIQCLIAGYQIFNKLTIVKYDVRFLGTMTNQNIFSACLLLSLPFIFITLQSTRLSLRILSGSALLLNFLFLIIAQTRSVWVGCALGFLMIVILLFYNKHIFRIISLFKANRITILFMSAIFFLLLTVLLKNEWSQIYSHLISLKNFDSNGRYTIWQKTASIISNNFILGVGPGNWRFHVPVINHIAFQRPHNDYLWVFAECGIFALLSYIGILGLSLYTIVRNLKYSKRINTSILYCLLFGFIGYCTDSMFSFPKERPYLLILLALLLAFTFSTTPQKILFKVSPRFFAGILLPATVFSLYFCWNRMVAEYINKKIIMQSNQGPLAKMKLINSIKPFYYAADPFSNPVKSLEGSIWTELGNLGNAKQCYREAYEMAPLNPEILINLGSILEISSDRTSARKYYNKALAIEPWNSQALLNLAVIEYKDGEKEKAADLVKKVDPNSIAGRENLVTQYEILKSSLRL
ncbi:MAG: O-antigen ligase family protein [Chitinispirillaceae bacterium]|nr:O-antigen ligase family protein [Chitinispirillaceae bacterium]